MLPGGFFVAFYLHVARACRGLCTTVLKKICRQLLVSCPAPFHARGEKGSGQTCIAPVSPRNV